MADVIFGGFWTALLAGNLSGSPDLRCHLLMSANTCVAEPDAVNVADITTLDEFDGLGYAALDCASVTVAYVDAADEVQIDFADGSFGALVAAGSDVIQGMLVKLYVDGTTVNDVVLGYTEGGSGFGANAVGGPVTITLGASGLIFGRQAV